jgi:hypothetical protein
MAGDWIKIRSDLPDEDEVLGIAHKLNIDPDLVVGKLVRFWAWVDKVSPNGRLRWATCVDIDRRLNCPGFAEALVFVGWLEIADEGENHMLVIPHYERHMSQSAKLRAVKARQKAKERRSESLECRHSVAKMSPCDGDKEATREEKRRDIRTPCKSPAGGRSNSLDTRPHLEIFNRLARAQGLPSIRMIGSARARKLKARIDETGAKDAGGFWAPIAKAVSERSAWARDQAFLTFDWLMSPTNLAKLLEGNYKGKASGRSTGGSDVAKFGEEGAT